MERDARRRHPSARARTRSSARSTSPSASTTRSPPRIAPTCPIDSSGRRRERAPARRRRRQHEDGRGRRRCSGAVLGIGHRGCGDIHNAASPEPAVARSWVPRSLRSMRRGATSADLAAAAFSLAGADWPEDFERLRRELTVRLHLRDEPEIVNDAIGGLRCGSDELVGVAVVIGTYSAVAGRSGDGKVFHLGFWPDKTGAFALGSLALAAVWRHMLGLGPRHRSCRVRSIAGTAPTRRSCCTRSRGSEASTSRSAAASPKRCSTRRRRAMASRSPSSRPSVPGWATTRESALSARASSARHFRSSSAAECSGTPRRSSATSSARASRTGAHLPGRRSRRRRCPDRG